jgi:hypothetical protein
VPSPLADLLAGLGEALDRIRVSWYLFGAQAAIVHGAARLSADVDVTVRLGAVSIESLSRALEQSGFPARVPDPCGFALETRVLPCAHTATDIPVDLVIAGPGLEDRFLERAVVVRIEGVPVPVASAEDVVVMKVLAGRPQDLGDAEAVARANDLDLAYVRGVLREIEAALDRGDLVASFEDVLRRAAR